MNARASNNGEINSPELVEFCLLVLPAFVSLRSTLYSLFFFATFFNEDKEEKRLIKDFISFQAFLTNRIIPARYLIRATWNVCRIRQIDARYAKHRAENFVTHVKF